MGFQPTLIDLGWSEMKALVVKTKINELPPWLV